MKHVVGIEILILYVFVKMQMDYHSWSLSSVSIDIVPVVPTSDSLCISLLCLKYQTLKNILALHNITYKYNDNISSTFKHFKVLVALRKMCTYIMIQKSC